MAIRVVAAEMRITWRAPFPHARRYLTKRAAYISWAKHMIREACACDFRVEFTCGRCRELFYEVGNKYDGEPAWVPDNTRYLRLRDRLARWLMWRDSRAGALPHD